MTVGAVVVMLAAMARIDHDQRITDALARLEAAVVRRPGFGRSTDTATATVAGGLRCCCEVGDWTVESDLPVGLGGSGAAPTPAGLLRAALASCLAMGYRLRAARLGVPVRSIRVTVETDSEIEGMLRTTATAPPGFTAIRYHVELDTGAPADEVEAMVDEADRLSPILDVVGGVGRAHRSLSIVEGAA